MPTPEAWVLRLHVAAGWVALASGVAALATAKGGARHRLAGRTFVRSMAAVVGTVLLLLAFDATRLRLFLALVAVFSGYLAFSGARVLSRKRPTAGADAVDRAAAGAVVAACLALVGWGVAWLAGGDAFGVVLVVFGGIGLVTGVTDVRGFGRPDAREAWPVAHLQRMLAAFIATVSAVSAVNLEPVLGVAAWLWPTAVGTPLVVYWSQRYGE